MGDGSSHMQVLQMIEKGVITAEQGAGLLAALDESMLASKSIAARSTSPDGSEPQWIRVRITDRYTSGKKVNVNIPLQLVNVGLSLGARFGGEIEGVDLGEIAEAIRHGVRGKVFDGQLGDRGERVEVFVE